MFQALMCDGFNFNIELLKGISDFIHMFIYEPYLGWNNTSFIFVVNPLAFVLNSSNYDCFHEHHTAEHSCCVFICSFSMGKRNVRRQRGLQRWSRGRLLLALLENALPRSLAYRYAFVWYNQFMLCSVLDLDRVYALNSW